MRLKHSLNKFWRIVLALCVVMTLFVLPGLPSQVAPVPVYAFFADGPYTVTLNTSCDSGFHYCGFVNFSGLGQIDGLAVTNLSGDDSIALFSTGCLDSCGGPNFPAWDTSDSDFFVANGAQHLCWRRSGQDSVCDAFFGAGLWTAKGDRGFANSAGPLSAHFTNRSGPGRVVTFYILYGSVSPTVTPTPTITPSPTITPTPNTTQTQAAGQTQTANAQTATAAPTTTPYPTSPYHNGGNLLLNWDMNIRPLDQLSGWSTVNRVVQSPIQGDPIGVGNLSGGSCGPKYWDMSTPVGSETGGPGSMWQQFNFPGGNMYINFEAQTSGYATIGEASITNDNNGLTYQLGNIYNPWGSWLTFKYSLLGMNAAPYTLKFYLAQPAGLILPNEGFAVDNTNARVGGWGNDCVDTYQGGLPPIPINATATPYATITPVPPSTDVNLLNNCDFEQGLSSWTPNSLATLDVTGGATGPNNVALGTVPFASFANGDIWQSFQWPGGQMYMSFWLKDGGAVNLTLSSRELGYNDTFAATAPGSSPTGWTKETFTYPFDAPGQYVFDLQESNGQTGYIDGAGVAAGDYAAGACADQTSGGANATQAAGQATATAAASPTAFVQTATAIAQATNDTGAVETAIAGVRQTETQAASNATSTQAAASTSTEAAQLTATAQGTPVPSATLVPTARITASPTLAPVPTRPPATQTQASANINATQTAIAALAETELANVRATQTALAFNQTAIAQTQTQQASVNGTQQAIILATALARQTGTAAAATQTQIAGVNATQTAQANATATAHAQATQTALVATGDANQIATATQQALLTQTAQAIIETTATAQANASATAGANATQVAQGTQTVQPRPEPAPYVDCNRPTNPLALADWMDYEVCKVLTWWVWTPDNTQQVLQLQQGLDSYEPLGTLIELDNARAVAQAQLDAYDWANTGLQVDAELPVIELFFPSVVPRGLLTGNLDLTPGTIQALNVQFVTTCSLKTGDIFGQAMAEGLCAFINWLVSTGIMGWTQYFFDLAVWVAFIRYAWYLVTTKLPQIL